MIDFKNLAKDVQEFKVFITNWAEENGVDPKVVETSPNFTLWLDGKLDLNQYVSKEK